MAEQKGILLILQFRFNLIVLYSIMLYSKIFNIKFIHVN